MSPFILCERHISAWALIITVGRNKIKYEQVWDKLLNAVVVINGIMLWSKLTTLCVVIILYGIIARKSPPRYWKQRALLVSG